MMKVDLLICSRPQKRTTINEKHHLFFERLIARSSPVWTHPSDEIKRLSETWPSNGVSLRSRLPKRVNGYVSYRARIELTDQGQFDDALSIMFRADYSGFDFLIYEELPKLIVDFDAYLAELCSQEISIYPAVYHKERLKDRRHGISFFPPVLFADAELLHREFGTNRNTVRALLAPVAETIMDLQDGLYIVFSRNLCDIEAYLALNERIAKMRV